MNFSVSAIIVAAGKGKRIGGLDKSFVNLNGKPIISYSFNCLSQYKFVREIIVVLNSKNIKEGKALLMPDKLTLTAVLGGDTRAESVRNGVLKAKEEFVLIHDAARPFVTEELLDRIFAGMASGVDAVIPVIPVKSTVKYIDENSFVEKTVDRKRLVIVQTPQLFRKKALLDAYRGSSLIGITDEAMLIEKTNGKVRVVVGMEENLKITTPFDLILMEGVLKKWSKE